MVYTIKLPFTSDGMKAVLNKEMLRENLNDCAGEFVIRPLRLKVVAWYYIYNFFLNFFVMILSFCIFTPGFAKLMV